jgi:hypothetical protein
LQDFANAGQVIMDVLDVLTNSPPGNPAWGLRLCEQTGYGTGTIYPALERLMKAWWITDLAKSHGWVEWLAAARACCDAAPDTTAGALLQSGRDSHDQTG